MNLMLGGFMDRERLIEILEENLGVTDEWGGSKLADWKWGCNVLVDGIAAAADAILEDASQSCDSADGDIRCPTCNDVIKKTGHCYNPACPDRRKPDRRLTLHYFS